MRQASRDMLKTLHTVSESRKAAARQRLELVKERIKTLKMLVSSGLASKGVLREIRALAKELGQVAKELSGNSPRQLQLRMLLKTLKMMAGSKQH